MASNIEIKARSRDPERQRAAALELADRTERLVQTDTFFNISNGYLKLRRQRGAGDYLVFYRRELKKGPKSSVYTIIPVKDALKTLRALSRLLGVSKEVFKRRLVCHAGRARIHLDEVRGLGRFIELEVVLRPGEGPAAGRREAARLMKLLRIRREDLLTGAYADML